MTVKKVVKATICFVVSSIIGLVCAYIGHKLFYSLCEDMFANFNNVTKYYITIAVSYFIVPILTFIFTTGLINGELYNKWVDDRNFK